MRRSSKNRRLVQQGFTLIELLLVMVIIAILASIVVFNIHGRREQADKTKAIGDLTSIKTALSAFDIDNGRYPTSDEGLQALVTNPANLPEWKGYLSKFPTDPWNHPYVYRCPGSNGKDFDLYSTGPTGQDQQGAGDNVNVD
jgi:general secretion pathway protein G